MHEGVQVVELGSCRLDPVSYSIRFATTHAMKLSSEQIAQYQKNPFIKASPYQHNHEHVKGPIAVSRLEENGSTCQDELYEYTFTRSDRPNQVFTVARKKSTPPHSEEGLATRALLHLLLKLNADESKVFKFLFDEPWSNRAPFATEHRTAPAPMQNVASEASSGLASGEVYKAAFCFDGKSFILRNNRKEGHRHLTFGIEWMIDLLSFEPLIENTGRYGPEPLYSYFLNVLGGQQIPKAEGDLKGYLERTKLNPAYTTVLYKAEIQIKDPALPSIAGQGSLDVGWLLVALIAIDILWHPNQAAAHLHRFKIDFDDVVLIINCFGTTADHRFTNIRRVLQNIGQLTAENQVASHEAAKNLRIAAPLR